MDERDGAGLADVEDRRGRLRYALHEPRRWSGSLRRLSFARNIQGSNSIEGYHASLDDTAAIELGEAPLDADAETRLAIKGYADALTYVLQLHNEPNFHFAEQLLRSLHFMMLGHGLRHRPGLRRSGAVWV